MRRPVPAAVAPMTRTRSQVLRSRRTEPPRRQVVTRMYNGRKTAAALRRRRGRGPGGGGGVLTPTAVGGHRRGGPRRPSSSGCGSNESAIRLSLKHLVDLPNAIYTATILRERAQERQAHARFHAPCLRRELRNR